MDLSGRVRHTLVAQDSGKETNTPSTTLARHSPTMFEELKKVRREGREFRMAKCDSILQDVRSCQIEQRSAIANLEQFHQSATKPSKKWWWFSSPPTPVSLEVKENALISLIPDCDSLTHALWSCRALAAGCGNELKSLGVCNRKGAKDECRAEQQAISSCVAKTMASMAESKISKI